MSGMDEMQAEINTKMRDFHDIAGEAVLKILKENERLRAALQKIADLPPVNMATRPIQKQTRDIAIKALRYRQ